MTKRYESNIFNLSVYIIYVQIQKNKQSYGASSESEKDLTVNKILNLIFKNIPQKKLSQ